MTRRLPSRVRARARRAAPVAAGARLSASLAAAAAAMLSATGPALAQVPPEARARHESARKLFDEGRYNDAAAEWERVYDLTGKAELLFNIGQCYRNAGRDEDALREYRLYLEELPQAANREEVERLIEELEGKLKALEIDEAAFSTGPMAEPPPRAEPPAPWWKNGWVWVVAGGVALVAGVAIGVAAASGDDGGGATLPPGPDATLGESRGRWSD